MKLRIAYGRRKYTHTSAERSAGGFAASFARARAIPGSSFTLAIKDRGTLPDYTAIKQYLADGDEATLVAR